MVLVQEDCNKLLCVAMVEESTGKVEAEKVKEMLDNWGLAEKVIACGFDTTSANTGVHKGSCVLLLSAINDSAERAIALATRFNTTITQDEASHQELLQVVEFHSRTYKCNTKDNLKKFM